MLLMATIGLHARAVTEATPEAKARLGVIAYVGKALEVLLDQEPFSVDLEFPEGPCVRLSAHAVTVANLVPARSVLAQGPPAVVPDDGLLDVTVVAFSGALDALATSVHLYTRALAGLPAEHDGVAFTRVAKLTIRAEPVQELMIDGEHVGCTPFTVECRPRSLQVLVPES
jgi:diacylglycerol kinase family enzyme